MTLDLQKINDALRPHDMHAIISGSMNGNDIYRIESFRVPTRGEQVAEKMVVAGEPDGMVRVYADDRLSFLNFCASPSAPSDWLVKMLRSRIAALVDAERRQARDTAFEEAAKVVERYWEVEKRHGTTEQKRADDAANYAMSIRMGIGTREETKP